MKLYSIANWGTLYENNRTRELRSMSWVPVPNSHDGDGYTLLVCRKNGAALLGAWLAILQVASRCDPRGTLMRDGQKPHDAASISRMTRLPEEIIQEALDVCTKECNWLICNEPQEGAAAPQEGAAAPQEGAAAPQEGAAPLRDSAEEGKGREGKGRKGKDISSPPAPKAAPSLLPIINEVVEEWNAKATAIGLPACVVVSDKRRRALECRLRDEFFKTNWRAAIQRMASMPFLLGEKGWKASFDWFIQPDSVAKIIEGKYSCAAINGHAAQSFIKPTRLEVQEYAESKDPALVRRAMNWFEYWDAKDWKKQNGTSIDWQVRLSECIAKWRTPS